jgi:hypothetical protein
MSAPHSRSDDDVLVAIYHFLRAIAEREAHLEESTEDITHDDMEKAEQAA